MLTIFKLMGLQDWNLGTMKFYEKVVPYFSRGAPITWCVTGWTSVLATCQVIWLPAILVLIPGIVIASLISATFVIPTKIVTREIDADWETDRKKNWGLLVLRMLLEIGGFITPIAGSIGYVRLLRYLIEWK